MGEGNCDNCNAIYWDESYSCNNCALDYCLHCVESGKVEIFMYGGNVRCTGCSNTEPPKIGSGRLLDFVLRKYKISKCDVLVEFKKANPIFTRPQWTYRCTQCPQNTCASSKCQLISENYGDPSGDFDIYRGYCCKAQGMEMCTGCKRWEINPISILMLGIRKFRTNSVLRAIPRDVLIYAMLKPMYPEKSNDSKKRRKGE